MRCIPFLLVIFLSFDLNLLAAIYYVNSATGNDGNTTAQAENPATPWLTIQHANDTAANGDTIHVQTGTYTENDSGLHCLKISKAITLIADGGVVTVKANASGTRVVYFQTGSSGSSCTGFTFDAESAKGDCIGCASTSANITLTNCTALNSVNRMFAIGGSGATGWTFSGCNFTSNTGAGIDGTSTGYYFLNCTFNLTGSYLLYTEAIDSSIIFSGNTVTKSMSSAQPCFSLASNSTFICTNNTFTAISGTPTSLIVPTGSKTGSILFANNSVTSSAPFSSQCLKIDNGTWVTTITNNTLSLTSASQAHEVIYLANQSSPLILNNTISITSTNQVDAIVVTSTGTACGTALVAGNTINTHAYIGHAIMVGTETASAGDYKLDGAIITNNIINGPYTFLPAGSGFSIHSILVGHNINAMVARNSINGGGYGIVMKADGATNTANGVFYNVCVNNLTQAGIYSKGMRDLPIFNNVIYNDPAYSQLAAGIQIGNNSNTLYPASGCMLSNNVVFIKRSSGSCYHVYVSDAESLPVSSDFNLFYSDTGDANFRIEPASTYATFGAWQGASYDLNGRNSSPSWVSFSSFVPNFWSPLINAGAPVGLSTDFAGNLIVGTPDIGAREYQGIVIPIVVGHRVTVIP